MENMETKPFFSVIVPIYNVENYLAECLDSILAQTYTDFELLLINDGSTDKSGEIAEQYANRERERELVLFISKMLGNLWREIKVCKLQRESILCL